MNWEAIGTIGEIAGTIAVFITLIYLAIQIRQSNRQNLLSANQHTQDSLNNWAAQISESSDLADIMIRGRNSYDELDDADRMRFDHIHLWLLNLIEERLFELQHVEMEPANREWAIQNLREIIKGYLEFPGTRKFWSNACRYYPQDIQQLVSSSIDDE